MELLYFPIRGRAEAIRHALLEAKQAYTETMPANWAEEKKQYPMRQMPILKLADGTVLEQSNAILRFIGREFSLYGSDNREMTRVDMIMDCVEDWRLRYLKLIYADRLDRAQYDAYRTAIADVEEKGMGFLPRLEASLHDGKNFVLGDKVSIADFSLAEVLEAQLAIIPNVLDAFPKLQRLHAAVYDLPSIKAYLASAPAHRAQFNGNGLGGAPPQ